jgi:predicted Holliday junction resolvase-like endonuclease
MKKKAIWLSVIMIIMACNILQAQTRIAVLQFTSEEKLSRAVLTYLTEVFTVEMVNSNDFVVVERTKLDAALREMKFQSGDMVDESTAVELGKMSGAEMVFFGTIFRFGGRNVLSVKGMDIKTATLKYAKQANGETDVQLETAVKTIAAQITKDENGSDSIGSSYSNNSRSGKLSRPEQDFHDKYIVDKWGISADSKDDMQYYYKRHKAGGVTLAVLGGVFVLGGTIQIACLFMTAGITAISGSIMLAGGCTMLPLCSIPFIFASRIATIYRKTSGKRLAFFERSSLGGGYDWDKKEVTVAMAIKL